GLAGGLSSPPPPVPGKSFSLFIALLPFIEQDNLYKSLTLVGNGKFNGQPGADSQYINCLVTPTVPNPPGSTIVKTYLCPSDIAPQQTTYIGGSNTYLFGANTYGGNAGIRSFYTFANKDGTGGMTLDGVFFINSGVRFADITDGTSNTFAFGERLRTDPNFDQVYSGAGLIEQHSGWAWSNYLPGYDYLYGSSQPINWTFTK